MSFQDYSGEDHRVLTWCCEQKAGSSAVKFILVILECTAKGIGYVDSMDSLCEECMVSLRTFKKHLNLLQQKKLVHVEDHHDGMVSISFGPYVVRLKNYRSVAIDDAWSIARAKTFALKGFNCVYCGDEAGQVDHVIPRCKGGTDDLDNLVPCCSRCNKSKGGRTPKEWLQ